MSNDDNYRVVTFHDIKVSELLETLSSKVAYKWTDEDMISFADWVDWANEESLKNWIEAGKPKRIKD